MAGGMLSAVTLVVWTLIWVTKKLSELPDPPILTTEAVPYNRHDPMQNMQNMKNMPNMPNMQNMHMQG